MSEGKKSYLDLINGDMPPWVMRFVKQTGKTINTYAMVRENDSILLSVSGGKDSLAMALALSVRRKWMPVTYEIKALMINWIEHPIPEEYREKLANYFKALDIDFRIVDERQYPDSFKGEFNCYLCSRNRRRIMFEYCQNQGISLVAMGHHLDDLVETTMMNICFRANFATMLPVQPFFDGKIHIVRPMIQVHESVIKRMAEQYDFPVIKPVCPYDQSNVRAKLKPIVSELSHIDKLAREHVFNAHSFEPRM